MYEPSRHLATYYIAGFQHWDGAFALGELRPGTTLRIVPEPDCKHDPEAVALYAGSLKLGYIPADECSLVSVASFYGHADVFEIRVLQVDPEAAPWHQVRVGLYFKDAR